MQGAHCPPGTFIPLHRAQAQPTGASWGYSSRPRTHRHGLEELGIEPAILCFKADPAQSPVTAYFNAFWAIYLALVVLIFLHEFTSIYEVIQRYPKCVREGTLSSRDTNTEVRVHSFTPNEREGPMTSGPKSLCDGSEESHSRRSNVSQGERTNFTESVAAAGLSLTCSGSFKGKVLHDLPHGSCFCQKYFINKEKPLNVPSSMLLYIPFAGSL